MTPNHVKQKLRAEAPSEVELLVAAARRHRVAPGIHCATPAYVNRRLAEGFLFVGVANELRFMTAAAKSARDAIRT